jgi:hypothetical protein
MQTLIEEKVLKENKKKKNHKNTKQAKQINFYFVETFLILLLL